MGDVYPELSWKIIASAIEVHRCLGPGLLEGTYRTCLLRQLTSDGISAAAEIEIPIVYRGELTGTTYRADVIVEDKVLLELKAVDVLLPVHSAQMLTYLKLTGLPLGLLINFNTPRLTRGIRRFANTVRPESSRAAVPFLCPFPNGCDDAPSTGLP
jgi:GxxExxY protein